MKEIKILYDLPIIMTKERHWRPNAQVKNNPGAVIFLPEDAVLVMPPIITETNTKLNK